MEPTLRQLEKPYQEQSSFNLRDVLEKEESREAYVEYLIKNFKEQCRYDKKLVFYKRKIGQNKESIFRIKASSDDETILTMDRLPLGLMSLPPNELKLISKILIILFYLASIIIIGDRSIFNLTGQCKIQNITNSKNFGFMKKVFGSKLQAVKINKEEFFYRIALQDYINSYSNIRTLLLNYIKGEKYQITQFEMDILEEHIR